MNARSKETTAARKLETLRLPELQQRYAEVIGTPTRCPNRPYLIRRIQEALAAGAQSEPTAPAATGGTAPAGSAAPAAADQPPSAPPPARADEQRALVEQRGRLKQMSVEDLQAMYLEVVGRPTGSSNVGYVEPVDMWSCERGAG